MKAFLWNFECKKRPKKKCTTFRPIFLISFQFLFQMMSIDHFQCGNGMPNDLRCLIRVKQVGINRRHYCLQLSLNQPNSGHSIKSYWCLSCEKILLSKTGGLECFGCLTGFWIFKLFSLSIMKLSCKPHSKIRFHKWSFWKGFLGRTDEKYLTSIKTFKIFGFWWSKTLKVLNSLSILHFSFTCFEKRKKIFKINLIILVKF